jgi:hypothetical protein
VVRAIQELSPTLKTSTVQLVSATPDESLVTPDSVRLVEPHGPGRNGRFIPFRKKGQKRIFCQRLANFFNLELMQRHRSGAHGLREEHIHGIRGGIVEPGTDSRRAVPRQHSS